MEVKKEVITSALFKISYSEEEFAELIKSDLIKKLGLSFKKVIENNNLEFKIIDIETFFGKVINEFVGETFKNMNDNLPYADEAELVNNGLKYIEKKNWKVKKQIYYDLVDTLTK